MIIIIAIQLKIWPSQGVLEFCHEIKMSLKFYLKDVSKVKYKLVQIALRFVSIAINDWREEVCCQICFCF